MMVCSPMLSHEGFCALESLRESLGTFPWLFKAGHCRSVVQHPCSSAPVRHTFWLQSEQNVFESFKDSQLGNSRQDPRLC